MRHLQGKNRENLVTDLIQEGYCLPTVSSMQCRLFDVSCERDIINYILQMKI